MEIDPAALVQNLIRASQLLRPELGQLYDFFNMLSDCFGFELGMLLIRTAEDDLFHPWCVAGFDETTCLNLHLDDTQIRKIGGDRPFRLFDGSSMDSCFFLSAKDRAICRKLVVLPINSHQTMTGLLLMADSPYFDGSGNELAMMLQGVGTLLRQIVDTHLGLSSVKYLTKNYPINGDVLSADLRELLRHDYADRQMIVVRLDRYCASYACEFPHLLEPALKRDIRNRVQSLLTRHVDAIMQSSDTLCLVLSAVSSMAAEETVSLAYRAMNDSLGNFTGGNDMGDSITCLPVREFLD